MDAKEILKEIKENKNKNCLDLQEKIFEYIPKEKHQEFLPLFMAYYHAVGTLNIKYTDLLIKEMIQNAN